MAAPKKNYTSIGSRSIECALSQLRGFAASLGSGNNAAQTKYDCQCVMFEANCYPTAGQKAAATYKAYQGPVTEKNIRRTSRDE